MTGRPWRQPDAPANWADRAACIGHDMSLPHTSNQTHINRVADRKRWLCLGCPVLDPCRTWAMSDPDPAYDHMVAGMTPHERSNARKKR